MLSMSRIVLKPYKEEPKQTSCAYIYARNCITFVGTKNNFWTVLECHRALAEISESNKVTVRWLKEHNGNLGNDEVDW